MVLELPDGNVVYEPPHHEEIEAHLAKFFAQLSERWIEYKPVEAAAFALWFINWVHPFRNGNGRSARAFCYASMAMKMGYVPPGEKTVPELIKEDKNDDEYQLALRVADRAYKDTGEPDLAPLERLLDRLIGEQLEAAIVAAEVASAKHAN